MACGTLPAMPSTRPRHIVWDWNGTLLDDVAACVAAINRMLRPRGLRAIEAAEYRRIFGFPVQNYYRALGFTFTPAEWDGLAREFHEHYAETSRDAALRRGVAASLAHVQARGTPMSVLSASERSILIRMLEARGIRPFFRRIYGLGDLYAHSKLDLGRQLLAEVGLPAAEVLLIGDTTHDYEVARELGCPCLLVAGGHQSPERLRACGTDVLDDAEAVAERLVRVL
jgi:phosphoglycolate phosphatase